MVEPIWYVPAAGPTTVTPAQMSLAVARPGVTGAPAGLVHSAVIGAGQEMLGGVVSTTVTLEPQEFEFPELSVALQDTGVVPNGKLFPDAGQLVEAKPQLSDALALKVAVALLDPVHSAVWGAGQVIVGASASTTVTTAVQESDAPLSSVTVSSTLVVPLL